MTEAAATRPYTAPQELHDLAFRYGQAVDDRDAEMLASVFTRDGLIRGHGQAGVRYAGAAGWKTMIAEVTASFDRTMHNVHNQTFDIAEDGTVTGLTTGIASHILPSRSEGDNLCLLDFAMRYYNRYAVEDGVWKFAERSMEVVWVETRQVKPYSPGMMGRELQGFAAPD